MGQNAKGKEAANGCLMANLGAKRGKVAPRQTVVFEIQELNFPPFPVPPIFTLLNNFWRSLMSLCLLQAAYL